MTEVRNRYLYFVVFVISVLLLNGCVSVSNSPNPRLYSLYVPAAANPERKINLSGNVIVGIGPVRIPEYINRPQIMISNKDKTIAYDEFNRWAESLDFAIERLINEDLAFITSGASFQMFPWDFAVAVKYQVIVDVIQLENNSNQDLSFVAQWSIVDLEKKHAVFTKRSELRQDITPHNYLGLSEAISVAVMSLSTEVARELALLSKPQQD
jgi:uncharacterized lipoprotein YmbA